MRIIPDGPEYSTDPKVGVDFFISPSHIYISLDHVRLQVDRRE